MTPTLIMSKKVKVFAWLMVAWNALGVAAFFGQLMMTPEAIATLPETQQAAYENIPMWSFVAFAIAVFGGLIGCVLLALARKLAFPVLVMSLVGVILQQYYNFFVIDSIALMGAQVVIMPIIVTVIAFALVLVSQRGSKTGWLK